MLPAKLTYLFIAEFKDGSRYYQHPSDSSLEHPLTRSAFWDITQRLTEVVRFTLTDGHNEHSVFLADGHFVTNGQIIASAYGELTNYRLIYFRRMIVEQRGHQHHPPRVLAYFIGWQANDARGRNYQMMLQIPPEGSAHQVITKDGGSHGL